MKKILLILLIIPVTLLYKCKSDDEINYVTNRDPLTGVGWAQQRAKINFKDSTYFTKELRIAGPWRIGTTTITTTGQELNLLSGATGKTGIYNLVYSDGPVFTTNLTLPLVSFVPTGGGFSWNAGDVVLQHSSNKLTLSGGTLDLPAGVHRMGTDTIASKADARAEGSKGEEMTYPETGIALSTGAEWGSSLTNTTVGTAFITLTNPGAITFPQINTNNTVSALSATNLTTAIGASHIYSDTMSVIAGVLRTKVTTLTTEPYSVQIFTSTGIDITHAVKDSIALNGGVYKLYVYSVDSLAGCKLKILY